MYKLTKKSNLPVKVKIRNISWRLINRSLFRYSGRLNFIRILLLKMYGAKVSRNVRISSSSIIELPWNLSIGSNSSLGPKTYLLCLDSVIIGNDTCISDEVALLAGSHDTSSPHFQLVTEKLKIGNGVWLAYRSVILPGTEVRDFAVVGACAVARGLVKSHEIVVGNPMVVLGDRKITEQ